MLGTSLKRHTITVPLDQKKLDDDSMDFNTSSSVSYHSGSSEYSYNIVSFTEFKQKSLQFLMATKGHTRRHSSHENSSVEPSTLSHEEVQPTRPRHSRQRSSPDVSELQGDEVKCCMVEIQRNIERERDTQEQRKLTLRQQVLKRFYAPEDNDTDRHSTGLKRCSSSETLNGPGSSFTLTQELSVDSRTNREVIIQALTSTAKTHNSELYQNTPATSLGSR
jgi:hypothetical protein